MKGQASRFPEAASFAQVPMPNLLLLQEQARNENEALLKFSHVYSNDAFLPAEPNSRPPDFSPTAIPLPTPNSRDSTINSSLAAISVIRCQNCQSQPIRRRPRWRNALGWPALSCARRAFTPLECNESVVMGLSGILRCASLILHTHQFRDPTTTKLSACAPALARTPLPLT